MANPSYAPDTGSDIFSYRDFERIGTLSFTQLADLRHRGAFSTVAHTFTSCCQRCAKSKDPEIRALPEIWYQVWLSPGSCIAQQLTKQNSMSWL
jgi:hypothetical protein